MNTIEGWNLQPQLIVKALEAKKELCVAVNCKNGDKAFCEEFWFYYHSYFCNNCTSRTFKIWGSNKTLEWSI